MTAPEGSTHPEEGARRRILARVEREAGVPDLASILAEKLSPADLQSLMLEVYALRAKGRRPRDVLDDYLSNRFVRPSTTPSKSLFVWEMLALSSLPPEFEAIELAPVAPLGTVSALAPLSQDWSISTSRNTEVVSDSTNALALEASARRMILLKKDPTNSERIHLATSHRLLRGQKFGEAPGVRQHFRSFALCSAGRDPGNLRFETEVACKHITFFVTTLKQYLGGSISMRVALADLEEPSHRKAIESGMMDVLHAKIGGVPVAWEEATPAGRAYYRVLRFHIYALHPRLGEKELVDGGAVDWGQKLANNGKERMFISGIGSERLTQLFETGANGRPASP